MRIAKTLRRAVCVAAMLVISAGTALAKSGGKEILMGLSWGDQVADVDTSGESPLLTAEAVRTRFRQYKQAGVDTVLFRDEVFRFVRDADWPEPITLPCYKNGPSWASGPSEKQWVASRQAMKANLLKYVVDIAHEEGLKIFSYNTTFNEGMPLNEVWHPKGDIFGTDPKTGKPWTCEVDQTSDMISNFVKAHPEYVMVDRSQKKHNWGTLEFAYPQARDYAVGENRWFLENYPFDGVYIDFRNEYARPEFGDQFGFAPPIVAEYQKRYGVNILREEFDLGKWRRLCGEYLTQFIREMHTMTQSRGKPLLVAVPQGNYMGPPISNMYLDWQGWVTNNLVEGLVIGVYSGSFLFPKHIGYGYLTSMEFGIGLPNLFWDLQSNYWPECARYNVKLYVHPSRKVSLADTAKTNVDGLYVSDWAMPALKEWEKASTH